MIPEDARAGGNGILIDGSAGDARFGGNKECIRGSTGEEITRRKPSGLTAGEAVGWKQPERSGSGSQTGEQGHIRRKPNVIASRTKGRRPMRIGGRLSALPEEGPFGASRMEPGSSGASLMDRPPSVGCAEQPMRIGCARRSSREHETDPSRKVGHRSSWSADRRRKSEVECRRSQRQRRQRKLGVGHWGSWRTQHRLYYE